MKTPRIIGLASALPGAGKDTLAAQIKAEYGSDVIILSFAEALTSDVKAMFVGWQDDFDFIRNDPNAKDWKFRGFAFRNVSLEFSAYAAWAASSGYDMDEARSIRDHMILYGTKYVRQFKMQPRHWVDKLHQRILKELWNHRLIVVTDVRFPEEAELVKLLGGIMLFIKALHVQDRNDPLVKATQNVPDSMCDAVILNVLNQPEGMFPQFLRSYNNAV